MSATEPEDRLLNASELEMVAGTKPPAIEQQSKEELKALLHRLRQAQSRAHDIAARQQREIRGKADPHGAKPVKENAGTAAKAQALSGAIQRLDAELSRREETAPGSPSQAAPGSPSQAAPGSPSQADLARHALELKMRSEPSHHPELRTLRFRRHASEKEGRRVCRRNDQKRNWPSFPGRQGRAGPQGFRQVLTRPSPDTSARGRAAQSD